MTLSTGWHSRGIPCGAQVGRGGRMGGCNPGPCRACRTACPPATGRPRAAVRGEAPPQRQAFLYVGQSIPINVPPETVLTIHPISRLPTLPSHLAAAAVCCSALQGGFQEFSGKNKWTLLHRVKFCPPPPPPPPPPWRHLSTFPGGRRARRMEEVPSGVIRGQTRAPGFSKAKLLSEITAKANAMEP